MKTYRGYIFPHKNTAASKGIISPSKPAAGYNSKPLDSSNAYYIAEFIVIGRNADDAHAQLAKIYRPNDTRPLAGKSYLKADKETSAPQPVPMPAPRTETTCHACGTDGHTQHQCPNTDPNPSTGDPYNPQYIP